MLEITIRFGAVFFIGDDTKKHLKFFMDVSENKGTPKWMVNIMENPIKIG